MSLAQEREGGTSQHASAGAISVSVTWVLLARAREREGGTLDKDIASKISDGDIAQILLC